MHARYWFWSALAVEVFFIGAGLYATVFGNRTAGVVILIFAGLQSLTVAYGVMRMRREADDLRAESDSLDG